MSKIISYESNKLNYNRYLYKIYIQNDLASCFRSELQGKEKLGHVQNVLNEYKVLYDAGKTLVRKIYRTEKVVGVNDYLDACDIFNALYSEDDYKIRIEKYHGLTIYSNNKDFLHNLANKLRVDTIEYWEPKSEYKKILQKNSSIQIINEMMPFKFKVYLKLKRIDPTFANWLKVNKDKSKVGRRTLDSIEQGFSNAGYFFVRDEKILTLVKMLIGRNISRVEELVYKGDIDKY